jgi:hypothetical protein
MELRNGSSDRDPCHTGSTPNGYGVAEYFINPAVDASLPNGHYQTHSINKEIGIILDFFFQCKNSTSFAIFLSNFTKKFNINEFFFNLKKKKTA